MKEILGIRGSRLVGNSPSTCYLNTSNRDLVPLISITFPNLSSYEQVVDMKELGILSLSKIENPFIKNIVGEKLNLFSKKLLGEYVFGNKEDKALFIESAIFRLENLIRRSSSKFENSFPASIGRLPRGVNTNSYEGAIKETLLSNLRDRQIFYNNRQFYTNLFSLFFYNNISNPEDGFTIGYSPLYCMMIKREYIDHLKYYVLLQEDPPISLFEFWIDEDSITSLSPALNRHVQNYIISTINSMGISIIKKNREEMQTIFRKIEIPKLASIDERNEFINSWGSRVLNYIKSVDSKDESLTRAKEEEKARDIEVKKLMEREIRRQQEEERVIMEREVASVRRMEEIIPGTQTLNNEDIELMSSFLSSLSETDGL